MNKKLKTEPTHTLTSFPIYNLGEHRLENVTPDWYDKIVRSVDSHEALLDGMRVRLDWLKNKTDVKPSELSEHRNTLIALTEKAIAKAEGLK